MAVILARDGLLAGRLLRRYQRFLADVELEDGTTVVAHCTNTGTMKTCWEPGDLVLLAPSANPARKLKYTWLACRRGVVWVGVDTGIPNRAVAQAAREDCLPGLPGLREVRTEVRYGVEHSRIDVLALDGQGRSLYVEVKNTTMNVGGIACFPDAVTDRGLKHLRELRGVLRQGHRSAVVFFANRGDVQGFDTAREVDPRYAEELCRAAQDGVEILPLRVHLEATPQVDGYWTLAWSLAGLLPWIHRPRAEADL